jgi:hypothetical protein
MTDVWFTNGQRANDQVTSIWNLSGRYGDGSWTCARAYFDINERPSSDVLWIHGSGQAFELGPGRFNDKISSISLSIC